MARTTEGGAWQTGLEQKESCMGPERGPDGLIDIILHNKPSSTFSSEFWVDVNDSTRVLKIYGRNILWHLFLVLKCGYHCHNKPKLIRSMRNSNLLYSRQPGETRPEIPKGFNSYTPIRVNIYFLEQGRVAVGTCQINPLRTTGFWHIHDGQGRLAIS